MCVPGLRQAWEQRGRIRMLALVGALLLATLPMYAQEDTPAPTATGTPTPNNDEQLATERAALVALYNATGGANWSSRTNWLSNLPVVFWHGVSTDDTGAVINLGLSRNNLNGSIPSQLGNLRSLSILSLPDNNLTGPIPSELGNLSKLKKLYLPNNNLTDPIPSALGNLSELSSLVLRRQ